MKSGDGVSDGQGRSFTVGELLGRGSWGSSWLVRDTQGRELVAKVALAPSDLLPDVPMPDGLLLASRSAVIEQAELLKKAALPMLPRFEGSFNLPDGRPVLLTARYTSTLKKKLAGGVHLTEIISLLAKLTRSLGDAGRAHGNLRPSNLFFTERGEPILADWVTPAVQGWRLRFAEHHPEREDYWPPEAQDQARPTDDTWALNMILWRAATTPPGARDPRREERFLAPKHGLDKVEVSALRDKVLSRLKDEPANPRFAPRLAERLGALLNRGLAPFAEPSPPYRFEDLPTLRQRIDEVNELIQPRVETVGQFLLAASAKNGVFSGIDALSSFSVTIGCSPGVAGHEDVACGVQLSDLDRTDEEGKPARISVRNAQYSVKAHPTGRIRFDFTLPELPPGRYRANVAFSIKDGSASPEVASGEFELRPPPGYVPPVEDAPQAPMPIPLPIAHKAPARDASMRDSSVSAREASASALEAGDPLSKSSAADRVRIDADAFPRPVAPSSPGEFAALPDDIPLGGESTHSGVSDTLSSEVSSVGAEVIPLPGLPPVRPAFSTPAAVSPSAPQPALPAFAPPASTSPSAASSSHNSPTAAPTAKPTEPPQAAWARPIDWDDVAPDVGGESAGYVPGSSASEDLPSWAGNTRPGAGGRNPLLEAVERGLEVIRRDTYTAFMVGIGSALALLAVSFLLIGSC
jgi:hypothetical protein